MKRFLSVIGYFIMSVALFLGGVILNSDLPGAAGTGVQERLDHTDDPDTPPGEGQDETRIWVLVRRRMMNSLSLMTLRNQSLLCTIIRFWMMPGRIICSDRRGSRVLSRICILTRGTFEEAEPILISVMNDHPEYFWLDNSYSYRTGTGSVEFIFNYTCAGGEKENRERIIEQQAAQIIAAAPSGGSDYEKVKYVFETLVDRTQYDKSAPDNQNIYSVFGNWTTVCAGYAQIYQIPS